MIPILKRPFSPFCRMVGPPSIKFVRYRNIGNSSWTASSQVPFGSSLKGGSLCKGRHMCVCGRGEAGMGAGHSSATVRPKYSGLSLGLCLSV